MFVPLAYTYVWPQVQLIGQVFLWSTVLPRVENKFNNLSDFEMKSAYQLAESVRLLNSFCTTITVIRQSHTYPTRRVKTFCLILNCLLWCTVT